MIVPLPFLSLSFLILFFKTLTGIVEATLPTIQEPDIFHSPLPNYLRCKGDGWVHHETSNKCFKLIKQYVTQHAAKELCQNSDTTTGTSAGASTSHYPPELATIKTEDEQQFITYYLFNVSKITSSVWIAGERRRRHVHDNSSHVDVDSSIYDWFQYRNVSDMKYQHWTNGSPTAETRKGCIELSSRLSHKDVADGEWIDVACEKPNWVLCEKGQDWSMIDMQHAVLLVYKILEATNKKLVNTQVKLAQTEIALSTLKLRSEPSISTVPIGFVYIQLPDQEQPSQVWPQLKWIEISNSSLLAGNFLRVLGSGSDEFGMVQPENFPRIIAVNHHAAVSDKDALVDHIEIEYSSTKNSRQGEEFLRTGDVTYFGSGTGLSFETAGGEVRPENVALRIWKRVADL